MCRASRIEMGIKITPSGDLHAMQAVSRAGSAELVEFVGDRSESHGVITADRGLVFGEDNERKTLGLVVFERFFQETTHQRPTETGLSAIGANHDVP